ncbi:MAG: sigma-54 dependent transcriptional regulator [Myxococcales bacterium]
MRHVACILLVRVLAMTVLRLPTLDTALPTSRAKALVFEDPNSQELLRLIERIGPSEATVLVTGETGTGKEIVARHLHELSARKTGPFVPVNCGALSETLVESELFGHERGAFTGANATRPGWFEAANGGTLFLDEIGDLPAPVQVKLLRVLQEREVVRVGSRTALPVDVRLIAATNVDLSDAVSAGRFREDLFYRLNVARIALPPLRERPGDILPLARYFVDFYRQRLGLTRGALSREAERALLSHPWQGNIRELDNVIHRALLVFHGDEVEVADLRLAVREAGKESSASTGKPNLRFSALSSALRQLFEQNVADLHQEIERVVVREAYAYCHRNQVQTARLLGISRNILRARLIDAGELPSRSSSGGAAGSLVEESLPLQHSDWDG